MDIFNMTSRDFVVIAATAVAMAYLFIEIRQARKNKQELSSRNGRQNG
jgi:hypothetical protein